MRATAHEPAAVTPAPGGSRIVAIHQPNFFPWLGYFDKIARADVFVLLDSVQFPKKQGTWMNRVQILVRGQAQWLTAPVDRDYHGLRSVRDMTFASSVDWRSKALKTLGMAYAKAPHFEDVHPIIEQLFSNPCDHVADFNGTAIKDLVRRIVPRSARLVLSSSLGVEGHATDLLISLTEAVGGSVYLAGGGASGYQDDQRFETAGLEVRHQDFAHPTYAQKGTDQPVHGLSVLDALYNLGFDGVRALVPTGAS